MKVIIAGGRDFNDFEMLKNFCDSVLVNVEKPISIVSGVAPGADSLGEKYAKLRGYTIVQFPADWDRYGKSAGYRRNSEMAEYGDALIAFWDGKSKGTEHMINLAKARELKIRVKKF